MTWTTLRISWASRVVGSPLASPVPPFDFRMPAVAWDYAVISDPLPPEASGGILKLRVRSKGGRIGVSLVKPNGSDLISQEAAVSAEDGETEVYFRVAEALGPAAVLLRNYGDEAAGGTLMAAMFGAGEDLDPAVRLLGPRDRSKQYRGPELAGSNVAAASEPMRPIALGNSCEAKVQISRVQQFRRWPQTSHAAFRLQMLPPTRSADRFGWDLFDWQGAPARSVIAYLEQDFQGLFEREDLQAINGGVLHRKWRTEHFHDFEGLTDRDNPIITEAMIDQNYAVARQRFETLCEAFRHHLVEPGPFLYVHVCEDIPNELTTRLLLQQLAARSPDHRFHLLYVGYEDEDNDLSSLTDQVTKAYRPRPPERSSMLYWGNLEPWEGDYAAWDQALAPFDLRLPSESLEPQSRPDARAPSFHLSGEGDTK
jgi:hypothetical protein